MTSTTDDPPSIQPTRPRLASAGVTFLVLLLVTVALFVRMIAPYLISLAMGGIIAVLAAPLQVKLVRRGVRPSLAALLITLGILLLIVLPLVFCVEAAVSQAAGLRHALETNRELLHDLVARIARHPLVVDRFPDEATAEAHLTARVQELGAALIASLLVVAQGLPATILQIAIAFMTAYFCLVDGRRLLGWVAERDTLGPALETRVVTSLHDTTVSSVWASILSALVQAVIVFVGNLLLGGPTPFLILFAVFIAAWVPLIGTALVTLPLALYFYLHVGVTPGVVMAVLGFLAGASDNVTRPLILRGRAKMHPLIALLSILGGMQLFGFYGVFLGPIFAGLMVTLLDLWPLVGRRLGLLAEPSG